MPSYLGDLARKAADAVGLRRAFGPTQRAGVSGYHHAGGFLISNEKSSDLRGERKYRTYSDMMVNVSIVAAGVRYYQNLVVKAQWKFEAPEDSGEEGERIAEFFTRLLQDGLETPWSRVVRRMSMYRFYGFSLQEWVARRDEEGNISLLDIEARPQNTIERWDIDAAGRVLGVVQRSPQTQKELYIPREKLLYIVEDSLSDSPEGMGLFRAVADASRRLRRYEQLEGFGFESDLRGVPVARAPLAEMKKAVEDGRMTPAAKAAAEAPLRSFMTAHVRTPNLGMLLDSATYRSEDEAATPSNQKKWDIDLLKSGVTTQKEVYEAIDRLNREIARVLGVEGLLLGADGKGSYALSEDKTSNFLLTVDSALGEMSEAVRRDVVLRVMGLNGWDTRLAPRVSVENVHSKDVEKIVAALRDMATAGATLTPDDPAVGEVRDLLGLSRPPQDIIDRLAADAELGGGRDRGGEDDPDSRD